MNVDSPDLLPLFKEQLTNETSSLVSTYSLDNAGQGLIWWYLLRLQGLTLPEVEDAVCDGGNDLGIDAIYIDSNTTVHFYQFKHPRHMGTVVQTSEIDKLISGLTLIINRQHTRIANEALKAKIEEIYEIVPAGYVIHIVSSGSGTDQAARVKLGSFMESLNGPAGETFSYQVEDLTSIHERSYTKSLPTISDSIIMRIDRGTPHMFRAANHDSYIFHQPGAVLAGLFDKYGEQLLQQNIRGFEGDQGTNRSIYATCTSDRASNFYHYNNGVTFLCEESKWDQFSGSLSLEKAQVVNGGQTMRILHRALKNSALRDETTVSIRVITSKGDKEFAGDVAVNLNNQTRVESSFLRSNDPRVIQLSSSLASMGWYLERKEGEVDSLTPVERVALEHQLGFELEGRIIPLKDGAQAFAATYRRLPEVAKKNPRLLFLGAQDGGYFQKVFGGDISAENFARAFELYLKVSEFVENFKATKRRKARLLDWRGEYERILGNSLVSTYSDTELDQVIPQSVIFLTGLLCQHFVDRGGLSVEALLGRMAVNGPSVVTQVLMGILDFRQENPSRASKSWPTLLKSQVFFDDVGHHLSARLANSNP